MSSNYNPAAATNINLFSNILAQQQQFGNNNHVANNQQTNSVVFHQTLKRRANKVTVPLDERITLEKALGFTINSNTRFAQSSDGLIAYLAGCVVVLYDSKRQTQEFIISTARKTLTCVAFSHDGTRLATGEVTFQKQPNLFLQYFKFIFIGHTF